MKTKASLRSFLALSGSALLLACQAQAIDYWWDNNGDTAGFGTAAGTWAVPTTNTLSTDSTGATAPAASVTTTDLDNVNFGTATVGGGLAGGTINVDGTGIDYGPTTFRLVKNMVFGSQNSGDIIFNSMNGGKVVTGNASITNNSVNSDVIFNADLKGYTMGFRGNNDSNIILNGDYFENNTTIFNINLQVNGTWSNALTKALTFRNDATFQVSSNSDIVIGNHRTSSGSNNSVITKDTSTTSTLRFAVGQVTTSADNEFGGKYSIQAGTMQWAKRNALYAVQHETAWTAANIQVGNTGVFAVNVGAADEFTTTDVTTLLANLGGANGTSTTGFAAGSAIGFDTTNAAGGTFTVADVIGDSTGSGGGALGVRKLGTNTLVLNNANTYTGATTIANGTLALGASGSIANTSGIYLTGAGAKFNVTTANFNLGASQTLGGIGTVENTGRTLTASGTLAPGSSPGTLTVDGGTLALAAGGDYSFQILDAAGIAGTDYDTVSLINGATLDLSALTAGSYTISLQTLASISPDVPGLASFNSAQNYSWTLFSTASSLLGAFDASDFVIDATNFANGLGGGSFSIGLGDSNTDLMLNFTAVPEPRAALLGGLGLLALLRRRRNA